MFGNSVRSTAWDHAGVIGSLSCITHCIATPLLASTLPVLAVTEHSAHIGFTLGLIWIGLFAFLPGYRQHSKPHMIVGGGIGLAMLAAAVVLPEPLVTETTDVALTLTGGMLLIAAHLTNAYYCRRCKLCGNDECVHSWKNVLVPTQLTKGQRK